MKQPVNLARALAVYAKLALLDEPEAAVDAQTRKVMQKEPLRIWDETRKTVIFITHQVDEAIYLPDGVVVLRRHPVRMREIVDIDFSRLLDITLKRS